jgi:hypothetical protein
MSTIRERDAEVHTTEYGDILGTGSQDEDMIAEDRRTLLVTLDALVDRVEVVAIPTLLVFAAPNSGVRESLRELRAAIARAKEITDG